MINRPFEDIAEADLDGLVTAGVAEGRTIDYKELVPGPTDQDKKEFLADVSSFANTAGGDLIIGVKEADGLPVSIAGLSGISPDKELQRIDSLIADGIEPRIQYRARFVAHPKGPLLVIRIARSWIAPHRVILKGHDKFYARNSAGKYPLDVTELRQAFLASSTLADRLRTFRIDRLKAIRGNLTPIQLAGPGLLVVHLLPLESFSDTSLARDVLRFATASAPIEPFTGPGDARINVDGVLTWSLSGSGRLGYTQIYRNGIIETVDARILNAPDGQGEAGIPSVSFEKKLLDGVPRLVQAIRSVGTTGPIYLAISLLGVKGRRLIVSQRQRFDDWNDRHPIDRDDLLLPEIELREDASIARALRPAIDLVWNACGYERSLNFRPDDSWVAPSS